MTTLLRDKRLLVLGVSVILALLVHNRWVVPRISVDQSKQLVALKNFVNGDEISFSFLDPNSNEEVKRNGEFPVGYYFMMAPFTLLSSDLLLLHRVVEILGILLLVFQLYQLGKYIGDKFNIRYFEFYLLLFTLIQLNPWRASGFTDIWSLYFFISAFRYSLTSGLSAKTTGVVSIFSFLTVFMRYAYYPLAFVAPLILLFRYRKISLKSLLPAGCTAALLVGMVYFHNDYFNNQTHIESQFGEERFFWTNLKQIDPLGFNAFFSDHVIMGALNLERWGEKTNWPMRFIILGVSLALLVLIGMGVLKLLKQFRSNRTDTCSAIRFDLFLVLSLALGITIAFNWGSITALSVYYPSKQENFIYTWSLISRYFAPSYLLLQLILVSLVLQLSRSILQKGMWVLLIVSTSFQLAYWGSFISRFSFTDTWANHEQFYGRNQMKEVMENRKSNFKISKEHLTYHYLSLYYLYDSDLTVNQVKEIEPDYFHSQP